MNISMYYSAKNGKRQFAGPQDPKMPFLSSMPYVTAAPKKGTLEFDSTYVNHVNQGLQRRLSKVKLDYEREKSWVDEQLSRIKQFKNGEIKSAADLSIVSSKTKLSASRKPSSLDSVLLSAGKSKKKVSISDVSQKKKSPSTAEQGLWKVPFTILNDEIPKEEKPRQVQAPSIKIIREQTPYHQEKGSLSQQNNLLNGSYDERESSQSFQDALKTWRQSQQVKQSSAVSTAISTEVTDGDADSYFSKLSQNKLEPVKVQFSENQNLSYFDRLLLSQKPNPQF